MACTVATVTKLTISLQAADKVRVEGELADWRTKLAERTARIGMTVAQAKAHCEAASERWYNKVDGYFETADRIRKERNLPHAHISQIEKLVDADMVKRGFVKPYDKQGPYGIEEAADAVTSRERELAEWKPLPLGAESVLSWHMTVPNAGKSNTSYWAEKGYALSVRTDIAVRETAKRGK